MYIRTILLSLFIALSVSNIWVIKKLHSSQQNYKRIKESFVNSESDLRIYKTLNGELAAKVDVLELRNNEIKNIYPHILSELKNLNINIRLAKQFSETVIEHRIEIHKELRDTIIGDSNKVKAFSYNNDFYDVNAIIQRDSIKMQINSKDSLIQVVYRGERKNPWLWFFSKRKLQQVIYSKNPNSHIQYSKVIEIKK